jgi:multicomponent Na+:H+ antiporter subunit G
VVAKLLLIWLLVLLASASVAHLIARAALRRGMRPWQR